MHSPWLGSRAGNYRHGFVRRPTIGFKLLYALVIVRLNRRDLVWINVTTNPSAEWAASANGSIPLGTNPRRVRCRRNSDSDASASRDQ
jgi:hypothetical protein